MLMKFGIPFTDYNFHWATMMIKGSLQVSIAVVKTFFDAKFSDSRQNLQGCGVLVFCGNRL